MTSTWREGLTMLAAVLAGAAVVGLAHQPWWVGSLVTVAAVVGLQTLWSALQPEVRGSQREEISKAERSDQQRR